MTLLSKLDEGNVRPSTVGTSPLLLIRHLTLLMMRAPFGNAGIACRLDRDGRVIGYIDVDQGHCSLHVPRHRDIDNADFQL
jgi:hypothetical protein